MGTYTMSGVQHSNPLKESLNEMRGESMRYQYKCGHLTKESEGKVHSGLLGVNCPDCVKKEKGVDEIVNDKDFMSYLHKQFETKKKIKVIEQKIADMSKELKKDRKMNKYTNPQADWTRLQWERIKLKRELNEV